MPKSIGGAVGYLVSAVVMFTVGYFVVTRIRPLWAMIQPRSGE